MTKTVPYVGLAVSSETNTNLKVQLICRNLGCSHTCIIQTLEA